MNESEYYAAIFPKLANSFGDCHWVLGYGEELIAHGWDPDKLLVTAEPIEELWKLTVDWNLQVYIPVFGLRGETVLFAKDAEIFLSDPYDLYGNMGSQLHYFSKHIGPVLLYETRFLATLGVPHLVDLTPSGWHILFWLKRGTIAYQEVEKIGYLEDDLRAAYLYHDPTDIKRNPPAGLDAGLVYSGIGRLKEYLALRVKSHLEQDQKLPITISDSAEKCINEDITDGGDSGFMRIMRSPFSLHKKRRHYFPNSDSLQDVIMRYYPGPESSENGIFIDDFPYLLECMWDKTRAVKHADLFTGEIPFATDTGILNLISKYRNSDLFDFHRNFDTYPELPPGEAYRRAQSDRKISIKSRQLIAHPNPRALQPRKLKKFITNLFRDAGWPPRHIGCLINDLYTQNHHWEINWMKYPSKTRANFWARIYCADALLEEGNLKL